MDRQVVEDSESRFATYVEGLTSVIGHADRALPLRDYCVGLLTAEGRKSVEPMAAVTASVGKLADTSLSAASAVAAANDFFNVDSTHPPQRVGGPPFDTATGLVAGTPADTVTWYTGEAGSDPARATATARVDPSITVSYGVRANEQGIRSLVQNVAVLAAVTFAPNDPNAAARSAALAQRVGTNLNVPPEEVAAQIMALQAQLQASLQTTSLLYKISLMNYI